MTKNVIDMQIDYDTCLEFAERFLLDGKYLEAMQNLNEALKLARKEKRVPAEVYARMLYIMNQTENMVCAFDVFIKLLVNIRGSTNYYIDDVDALMKDAFPQDEEDIEIDESGMFVNMSEIKHREMYIRATEYAKNQHFDRFTAELDILYRHSGRFGTKVLNAYLVSVAPYLKGAKRAQMMDKLLAIMEHEGKTIVSIVEFILSANVKKYIDILEKNFKQQLNDYRDNPYLLMCLGCAYMKAERNETAQYFFVNSLAVSPYEEETLWSAALNSYLMGRPEQGRQYLNTFAALFEISNVPVQLYRDFMSQAPVAVDYPEVSREFFISELMRAMGESGEINYDILENLFFAADKEQGDLLIKNLAKSRESGFFSVRRAKMLLNLLESARVLSEFKPALYSELIEGSYSGPVSIIYNSELYVTEIRRVIFENADIFNEAYLEILKLLPFSIEYIPTDCKALQAVLKEIKEKNVSPSGSNPLYSLVYAALCLYTKRIGVITDLRLYKEALGVNDRTDFFKELGINGTKKASPKKKP